MAVLYQCNSQLSSKQKYCEAIMGDLLLFTPPESSHMAKLEDLLKALLKNGLKISLKKCQLFRTNLNYMGNEIFIQNKRVCVKPPRSRLEAIQNSPIVCVVLALDSWNYCSGKQAQQPNICKIPQSSLYS